MKTPFGRFGILSSTLLALFAFFVSACGDDVGQVELAELVVEPMEVSFPQTAVGETSQQGVTFSNVGLAELVITDIVFSNAQFSLGVDPTFPLTFEAQSDLQYLPINFTPTTTEQVSGTMTFVSNSRGGDVVVQLESQESRDLLIVSPNPVTFGRVPAGSTETIQVSITNAGSAPTEINDLFVSGSQDFVMTSDIVLPVTLNRDEFVTLSITYSPESDGFDEGILLVSHRPAGAEGSPERIDVPINANGAEPCIAVTHEEGYDFGQRSFLAEHDEVFTITNCSDETAGQDLVISGMSWIESHDWFRMHAPDTLPQRLELETLEGGGQVTIAPQDTRNFIITFAPQELESAAATFQIVSNDEIKNPLDIEVRGLGSDVQCPIAVAQCRVRGTMAYDTELSALPLDYIECDGSNSSDDGAVASYQWTVIGRPDGSTAEFTPNGSVVNPAFFVDLAGRYEFQLNVVDDEGVLSCEPSNVTIVATPGEAIHVQLVWTTPADSDETDSSGSDVDLHFMHQLGNWSESPYDVSYRNPNPNWGDATRSDDDPSLDIDDVNGAGPENINLDNPEDGVNYRVGVHYYSDHGYGASTATLRIFINGVHAFEADQLLDNGDNSVGEDVWDVATISWTPGQPITRIGRVEEIDLP